MMRVPRVLRVAIMILGVFGLCFVGAASSALADYPERPIELVVPYGAGGGNDLTARAIAAVAPDYLGQPLVIRIRPGAGSVLGLSEVARARPDGYTLALPGPHSLVSGHFQDIPINLLEDFEPIAGLNDWPFLLMVPADSPFQTYQEFYEYVRDHPGEVSMGNAGSLTVAHLPALQWEAMAGVEVIHVPFDGGGPVGQALQTGSIDSAIGVPAWAVPLILNGHVRALAVTGEKRMDVLPDVPTFRELGYDITLSMVVGVVAPKGVPADRLEFLRKAFAELAQDRTYNTLIERLGDKVVYWDPEAYFNNYRTVYEVAGEIAKQLRAAGVVQ